jgi:hypothetical protein
MNNSTRDVLALMSFGLTKPGFTGSCKKNGAPSISRPATDPRLHNKRAPSALLYQSTASGVSVTASMTEMVVLWGVEAIILLSLSERFVNSFDDIVTEEPGKSAKKLPPGNRAHLGTTKIQTRLSQPAAHEKIHGCKAFEACMNIKNSRAQGDETCRL